MSIVKMYDKDDKKNINNLYEGDSFAVWFNNEQLNEFKNRMEKAEDDTVHLFKPELDKKALEYFDKKYFPNDFEEVKVNYKEQTVDFKNTHYVLLGMNPGEGVDKLNEPLLGHHAFITNNNHKLGAAIANTDAWGCLITDLKPDVITSKSSEENIPVYKDDIVKLEEHLDALNIDDDALIFIMGSKDKMEIYNKFKTSHRVIAYIPHPSGQNQGDFSLNRWKTEQIHTYIMNLIDIYKANRKGIQY